jgi:hypothetical protein
MKLPVEYLYTRLIPVSKWDTDSLSYNEFLRYFSLLGSNHWLV